MTSQRKGKDDSELLERLYPVPLSTGVVALPGPTEASSQVLLGVLKHNRANNHIFFNEKGYHKYVKFPSVFHSMPVSDITSKLSHATHHMLAIYGLGASPQIIEDAYKTHDYLKPSFDSPEPITDKNFTEHLGDGK